MSIVPPTATPIKSSGSTAKSDADRLRAEVARLAAEHHQRSASRGVADEDADLDLLNRELGGQP
jgi:hypothetical protein